MQIFQSTANQNNFKFNGLTYPRNFMIIKQGNNNIAVHNAYDTRLQLMESTPFNQIQVNGVVFGSQAALMTSLSTLLFVKDFNIITESIDATKLISYGAIIVDGNTVTVEPVEWHIMGEYYQTTINTDLIVPYSSAGNNRIDIIVGTSTSEIILIQGDETDEFAIAPITPPNSVYISQISVSDVSLGIPTTPINGGNYITKAEKYFLDVEITGDDVMIDLFSACNYRLSGDATTIIGFQFYNSILTRYDHQIYVGKEFIFINQQSSDITLLHNAGATIPMMLINDTDYVLKPFESVRFLLQEDSTFLHIDNISTAASTLQEITNAGNTTTNLVELNGGISSTFNESTFNVGTTGFTDSWIRNQTRLELTNDTDDDDERIGLIYENNADGLFGSILLNESKFEFNAQFNNKKTQIFGNQGNLRLQLIDNDITSQPITKLFLNTGGIDMLVKDTNEVLPDTELTIVPGSVSLITSGYAANLKSNLLTDNRDFEFPDNSGTIALLSDISSGGGIPLTGTISGSPVTGDIEMDELVSIIHTNGDIQRRFWFTDDGDVQIQNRDVVVNSSGSINVSNGALSLFASDGTDTSSVIIDTLGVSVNNKLRIFDTSNSQYGQLTFDDNTLIVTDGDDNNMLYLSLSALGIPSGTGVQGTLNFAGINTSEKVFNFINKGGNIPVIGYTAPSGATATGVQGEIRVTSAFTYTCIATNTWVRSAAATW